MNPNLRPERDILKAETSGGTTGTIC